MSANKIHPQPVVLMLVLRGQGERQEVLLGRKLTGFGAGNMVAPGGKIEPGEQAAAAAMAAQPSLRVRAPRSSASTPFSTALSPSRTDRFSALRMLMPASFSC